MAWKHWQFYDYSSIFHFIWGYFSLSHVITCTKVPFYFFRKCVSILLWKLKLLFWVVKEKKRMAFKFHLKETPQGIFQLDSEEETATWGKAWRCERMWPSSGIERATSPTYLESGEHCWWVAYCSLVHSTPSASLLGMPSAYSWLQANSKFLRSADVLARMGPTLLDNKQSPNLSEPKGSFLHVHCSLTVGAGGSSHQSFRADNARLHMRPHHTKAGKGDAVNAVNWVMTHNLRLGETCAASTDTPLA